MKRTIKIAKVQAKLAAGKSGAFANLERLSEKIQGDIEKQYTKTFGTETSFSDWEGGKAAQTRRRLEQSLSTKYSKTRSLARNLKTAYVKAWRNKYKEIISKYRSKDPGYFDRDWYKYKKDGKGRLRPNHNPRSTIKFTSHALATGFLRDSIERSFRSGGGKYLNMPNLLLQSGAEVKFDKYDKDSTGVAHYQRFVEHLVKLGVLQDPSDFTTFLDDDVRDIATKMRQLIEANFADGVAGVLESLNEEI